VVQPDGPITCEIESMRGREERVERMHGGPHYFKELKNIITHKPKNLNSDYTIKFVSINPSK
jgi:hypothetical protein